MSTDTQSPQEFVEGYQREPTTFKNYLICDEVGPIPYSPDIQWPEIEGLDLNFYNDGKFPFYIGNDINFLKFKAGVTAKEMGSTSAKSVEYTVRPSNNLRYGR